jgi:hypothetical protein
MRPDSALDSIRNSAEFMKLDNQVQKEFAKEVGMKYQAMIDWVVGSDYHWMFPLSPEGDGLNSSILFIEESVYVD